jgi:hypothetical protein
MQKLSKRRQAVLVACGAIALALAGVVWWVTMMWPGDEARWEDCARVKVGMSRPAVEQVLGRPLDPYEREDGRFSVPMAPRAGGGVAGRAQWWKGLQFRDGVLVDVYTVEASHPPGLLDALWRWLGD